MGALWIFIARSKVDQTGKGMEIYIELVENSCTCPVRLFWKYLEWRGQEEGLLFRAAQGGRLSTQAITSICQRMVAAAGLQVRVSSHSLWIGGATAAMMAGLTREQIMTIGGWSSADLGIGDDQAEGVSQDGLVILQTCQVMATNALSPILHALFACSLSISDRSHLVI